MPQVMKVFDSGVTVVQVSADTTIKATPGVLYGLFISHTGATKGDLVVIKDGTAARLTYVCAGAEGTFQFTPGVGMAFGTSIVVDVTLTGSPGMYVTLAYA
jgi:hypothetical protein